MGSLINSLLQNGTAIITALSQTKTNGGSLLGTLQAPDIADFLTNNPLTNGYPWGSLTASNTNPYSSAPNTGVVRSYDLTIARALIAPDGYQKSSILINGQFPGPLIEANWGDTIQVTVHNQISNPAEGTTLHWHGLLQSQTQWEDGVPAVSECPIAPGATHTYSFKASLYGSTWYHSHYSGQYAGGLWGPLIVHGPKNVAYDIDVGPVTLSDYYHRDYFSILEDVMGNDLTKVRPASDNNLINGKMNFDCSNVTNGVPCTNNAGLAKFKFTAGKKHRLRLINTSGAAIQKFSIDNHTMTVMANDFVPVQPYTTNVVTLAVAQRTDVIVEATGPSNGAFWMRSTISQGGQCTEPAHQPYALAVIYYQHANTSSKPTSVAHVDTTDPCANDPLTETVPFYSMTPGTPSTTKEIDVNFAVNSTGHLNWLMNNETFHGDYNNPLLLLAKTGNQTYVYNPSWNVVNLHQVASVRIYVKNLTPTSHPMHLHGHNMWVLQTGTGSWDGNTITNANNPQRRDVALMPASGYLIIQWNLDNPGVWPFHCHIVWHVSAGLHVNFLERPNDVSNLAIPSTSYQQCRDWSAYTNTTVVDQIDSGL